MIALNIFLAVMAAFFGFGSVGDRIQKNRDNYTRVCIASIIPDDEGGGIGEQSTEGSAASTA